MKTLRNNFTTPEQSKLLLEIGVPADSADCYLLRTRTEGDTFIVKVLHDELYSRKDKFDKILEYLPCWSVGRIIEICKICGSYELAKEIYGRALMYLNTVDGCICEMSYERNKGNLDFSKLEE